MKWLGAAIFLGLVLLILVLVLAPTSSSPLTAQDRLSAEHELRKILDAADYIVSVYSADEIVQEVQAGFVVDPQGYVITAAHGRFRNGKRTEVVLKNGTHYLARLVGEIQTLDIALLFIELPKSASALPVFANPASYITKRGYGFSQEAIPNRRNLIVGVQCTSSDFSLELNRMYFGELQMWYDKEPVLSFTQMKQNMSGCSGAPALTLSGTVIGMVRASAGDVVFTVDATAVKEAATLLIERDLKTK